jgi:hypothetical protein
LYEVRTDKVFATMTPTLKKKLLERINAGMDSDSAAAELQIPVSELHKASKRFAAQIDEATRAGSARLRGRLFKNALSENDSRYLESMLEKRMEAAAAEPITAIVRTVISAVCEKCGHKPRLLSATTPRKPTNGQAAT